ncbi:hypothetical protein [Silvibacterium acidisoli]|uniref:hypothetical protein n=1 Tax=Acidobacteriaceae bacterium ZG23-2 TaxID=2883246 RepID=UPI00406CD965
MKMVLAIVSFVLAGAHARAEDSHHCTDNNAPWTYHAQPGDISSSTRFEVQRTLSGLHSLRVSVCEGELRLAPSAGDRLHIEVNSPGAEKPLGSYVQTLNVDKGEAVITLQFPKDAHATVTLYLPRAEPSAENEINLGAGTLRCKAHALRGNRELNLGAGSIYAELDGDHDYATLDTSIGVGHLSDDRPKGNGAFGIISKNMTGSGDGDLKINVGAGSVHLTPDRDER